MQLHQTNISFFVDYQGHNLGIAPTYDDPFDYDVYLEHENRYRKLKPEIYDTWEFELAVKNELKKYNE